MEAPMTDPKSDLDWPAIETKPGTWLLIAGVSCLALAAIAFVWGVNIQTVSYETTDLGTRMVDTDFHAMALQSHLAMAFRVLAIVGAIFIAAGAVIRHLRR